MRRQFGIGLTILGPLWVAMASLALGADPVKVGVMDQQLVIERSKAGKRALEDLKAYSATRQKIINSDDLELKELEQSIQDSTSDTTSQEFRPMSPEELKAYLENLRPEDFGKFRP